jgi:hypothetical protein
MRNGRYCNCFIQSVSRQDRYAGAGTALCASLKQRLLMAWSDDVRCKHSQACVLADLEAEQIFRRCFENSQRDVNRNRDVSPFLHLANGAPSGVGMENGKGNVISRRARLEWQCRQQGLNRLAIKRLTRNACQRGDVLATGSYATVLIKDDRSGHVCQYASDWGSLIAR